MRLRGLGRSLLTASSCLHNALQSAAETAPGRTAMMPWPGSLRCHSHFHASASGRGPGECCAGTPAQQQRALHRATDANARRPSARHPAQAAGPTCCHAGAAAWPDHCCCPRPLQREPLLRPSHSRLPHRRAGRGQRGLRRRPSGREQGKSGSPRRQAELKDSAAAVPRQPQQQRSAKRPRPDGDQPAAAAGAQAGTGVPAGLPGPSAAARSPASWGSCCPARRCATA